jgi:hypothetical protein
VAEYTPTTSEVRRAASRPTGNAAYFGTESEEEILAGHAFDRWLTRDREAVCQETRTDLYQELERSLLKEIDERGDTRISDDYIAGMRAAALIAKGEAR